MKQYFVCLSFLASLALVMPANGFEFKDGDRVVLLGSAYIERMQHYGYLEASLAATNPDIAVTYRNLGWSGDDATGIARALFGTQQDGFKRLINDTVAAKPTVILICYGANEADAGAGGIAPFRANMLTLLDALKPAGARIVLLSPHARESLGAPLPDHADYNQSLVRYASEIEAIARERRHEYVDLQNPLSGETKTNSSEPLNRLTYNGLHFSQYGYWRTAPIVARRLGVTTHEWRVSIDGEGANAEGVAIRDLKTADGSISFHATDAQLPLSPTPETAPTGARLLASHAELKVSGLPEGDYGLSVDGKPVVAATHEHWAKGVAFNRQYAYPQLGKLRTLIAEKNTLYFHRYRPQNETYLLLFRKHEQGNNAVEIPQFDPLVDKLDQQIQQLVKPQSHKFELKRLEK